MFVIVNPGRPASPFGAARSHIEKTGHSYTGMLQHARVYKTREDAMRDKCGNEIVLSVYEIMEANQ